MDSERISALCVTRGNPVLLERAIRCFRQQTHENKELILVCDLNPLSLEDPKLLEIQSKSLPNEHWFRKIPGQPLGFHRNAALEHAAGTYVMNWDDDDWSHPWRMESMMLRLLAYKLDGVMQRRLLLWNSKTHNGFISFDRPRGWENTILMKRECALAIKYPASDKGEDSQFVARFNTKFKLKAVDEQLHWMYAYIYHGSNTWDYVHFQAMFRKSQELAQDTSESFRRMIAGESVSFWMKGS